MNPNTTKTPKSLSPILNNWDNKYKLLMINRDSLSKKYYQDIIVYDLILKQNYTNIMQLPHLNKIVLNTTSKTYITDKKYILFTLAALELISGQRPQLTYARKSIANFKIRQHQLIGCKVVLSEDLMYTFLDKLSKIIFPRIRDSLKKTKNPSSPMLQKKQLERKQNIQISAHSFGFQNMMIFPELENNFELVEHLRGMTSTFVVSRSDLNTSRLILSGFQLPFVS